jgi:hypothetical protein
MTSLAGLKSIVSMVGFNGGFNEQLQRIALINTFNEWLEL